MTAQPAKTNPAKPDRRKTRLEHIPFVREVPVVASATMVALRYVGAWLRAGDQESGGFFVRLGALGIAGYIALYFTEKHPGLWYIYGATGLVVVTTVAVRTGLSAGRTVKDLEAAHTTAEEESQENDTTNDHETAGEQDPEATPPQATSAEAEAAFMVFVEHSIAFAVRQGRRGVHTDTLLKRIHQEKMLANWTEPMLRQKCKALDIPVRTQMGIQGRNYFGVHIADLEQALGRPVRTPAQLVPDLTPNAPAAPPVEPPAPPAEVAFLKAPAEVD
ncbi:hypothetical protein [Streptomyces lavendulae]|uniref:hypothetical protein n=1 Tax=Streptomyces lavendulae TaxID=1914 RepID=UPI0024A1C61A|nr:hypothetical protein [Streptomyces lavendulae]GLX22643.1 hypothetical protein Slala01_62870 [Streptomyces lavendulae subsp. lavendulae]GLX30126.1 hypothetical protein Slala02_59460 [Streptomyces lavendulae subsp. lavendulae]